jgi:hypothetical protein
MDDLMHALGQDASPHPAGKKDPDYVLATTRAAGLAGPLETLSGTATGSQAWELNGVVVIYVDTGEAQPVSVVLNQGTRASWPSSWGKPLKQEDPPAFALARHAPWPLKGMAVVVHARAMQLPYGDRRQYFALDVRFR